MAAACLHRAEQLEAVINGMGDGLVLQDNDNHRLLVVNAAAIRMNGFEDETEARAAFEALIKRATGGAPVNAPAPFAVLDVEGNELPQEAWPLSRACRHESFDGVEVTIENRTNGYRWTGRFNGTSITDEPGQSRLFVTTMQDITARRRAEEELRDADRRLAVLHEAVSMLLASDQPLALLDQLYERLAELLGVECYFHFAFRDNQSPELIAYRGIPEETAETLRDVDFGATVCGMVATRRCPAVLEDVQGRRDPATDFLRRLGITAYVCHPLVARGELIGTLSFATRARKRFKETEVAFIETICDQVALALERERGRSHLSSSEERVRLALDAGHMGAFDWDLPRGTVTWDAAIYRMFGCEPGSVIDVPAFCRRVHPDDRAMLERLREQQFAAAGSELLDVEFRIVRPDGEVRWIASRGRVSRDENGQAVRVNGISFDITERKRLEELQRLAHIAGQVGTFYWDISNDQVAVDRQFEITYGLDPAKTIATYQAWLDCLHPHDRACVARAVAALFDRRDPNWRYEFRIVRPDGEVRWIEERATVFYDADGRPRTCIGVDVDITTRREAGLALQQSEDRFRRAFASAPIGMALTDLRGRFLHVNRAFCSIVGHSAEELLQPDHDFRHVTHPDNVRRVLHEVDRLLAGDIPAFFVEMRHLRKDASVVWARVSATVQRNLEGAPVQIIGLVEDITQRKEAEEALKEADRRKDDFLAALGHELRNPLAPIRNAMQILRRKVGQEPHAVWAAEVTERQVQQMTRLVDDLLDVSRINRGKLEFRADIVDLADVIRRSVEMAMPLIERRYHRIEVDVPSWPVLVRGDAARLTQVMTNLLSNAAKFTPPQGVIKVMLEVDDSDALVRVQDNGVGIAPAALKDMFEPFRQFNAGAGPDQAGLGLGLALAKRLIELHGGSVEARSEGTGRGSEFRVRLTRTKDAPLPRAMVATEARKSAGQLRIVVVDDNRDVAESLTALLQMLGHEAYSVFSGTGALEVVPRLRPDLVICDIGLPDVSGHEVALRLRGAPGVPPVRLVAMTGFGRDSERAIQSGFDEWFLKPVDVATLESMLERSRRRSGGSAGQE